MRRDDLNKSCWNLRKRSIVLLIILLILFTCSDKFSFISNVKPRCFWNKLLLNGISLNKRVGWSNFLLFLLNIIIISYAFLLKSWLKIRVFRLSTACTKINQIPYVIFQTISQFYFKFCITLQCHDTKFLWNFLAETLYTSGKKSLSK